MIVRAKRKINTLILETDGEKYGEHKRGQCFFPRPYHQLNRHASVSMVSPCPFFMS